MNDLKHEIKAKLDNVYTEGSPCGTPDVIELIIAIERYKLRFLHGDISAKQLYGEVAANLDRFKTEHPGFNFLNDSIVNAYYS